MSKNDNTATGRGSKAYPARKSRYGLDDQAFMVMWCHERAYRLTAYEQDFIEGMFFQKPLSERQERFLEKTYRRLGGDGYPNTRSRNREGVER